MDEALVSLAQAFAARFGMPTVALDCMMFQPTEEDLSRFKTLQMSSLVDLQSRFALVKYLNRLVTPLLHYVDVSALEDTHLSGETVQTILNLFSIDDQATLLSVLSGKEEISMKENRSLSSAVHRLKGLYFVTTKQSVLDSLLEGDSPPSNPNDGFGGHQQRVSPHAPVVQINRMKAAKAREQLSESEVNGIESDHVLRSIFGQMFSQMRTIPYSNFKGRKNEQMWKVTFLGEGSIDVGGPYRESLTEVCSDLMSNATPLFIQSPNGKNDVGLNREKWIPNPAATSSQFLEMFEFVGVLMGVAVRTKNTISLDLPSLVWKKILSESVDLSDLEAVDKLCVQALSQLKTLKEHEFNMMVDEKFTTQLSGNVVHELKEGGAEISVTYESRAEFVDLCFAARLEESKKQVEAIRKGLNQVVPLRMLSLFNWHDLEVLVCGNPVIDVETLRRHTIFNGYTQSSNVIKYFFKALHSFNTQERQMFLRFVWGRNRLPSTDRDWSQQFTINMMRAGDESLPIAHTCFFSIDLPDYSSLEITRQKLLYAVFNCTAIDVDFNPNSSSLDAWVEAD
jgi:hypothetical protein